MTAIQLDNTTKDLMLTTGTNGRKTLSIGETLEQCEYLILSCHPGEIKEYPSLGVGIHDYTNDNDRTALKHSIRENLKADGIQLQSISFTDNSINIQANKI